MELLLIHCWENQKGKEAGSGDKENQLSPKIGGRIRLASPKWAKFGTSRTPQYKKTLRFHPQEPVKCR